LPTGRRDKPAGIQGVRGEDKCGQNPLAHGRTRFPPPTILVYFSNSWPIDGGGQKKGGAQGHSCGRIEQVSVNLRYDFLPGPAVTPFV